MSSAPRILVVYAHPTPHHSRVNRRLAEAAQQVPNARVDNLYETYPDFYIDVRREQA
jgi:putative NADPH-quinone reductase